MRVETIHGIDNSIRDSPNIIVKLSVSL